MSDFARPPEKPPRAGKGTFRQTIGLHPLVERRKKDMKRERKDREENEPGTKEDLKIYLYVQTFSNAAKKKSHKIKSNPHKIIR